MLKVPYLPSIFYTNKLPSLSKIPKINTFMFLFLFRFIVAFSRLIIAWIVGPSFIPMLALSRS